MAKMQNRGVAVFIVLSVIISVIIFANIVLSIIANQSRLTHHKVSRIQAHYAAMAGVNYAYEKLRLGDPNWPTPTAGNSPYQAQLCNGCVPGPGNLRDIDEPDLPPSVTSVVITVSRNILADCPEGNPALQVDACIQATANYN